MPEGSEAKLARIDERTHAMDKKLDEFIAVARSKEREQDAEIKSLNIWKNFTAGAVAILGALLKIHVSTPR